MSHTTSSASLQELLGCFCARAAAWNSLYISAHAPCGVSRVWQLYLIVIESGSQWVLMGGELVIRSCVAHRSNAAKWLSLLLLSLLLGVTLCVVSFAWRTLRLRTKGPFTLSKRVYVHYRLKCFLHSCKCIEIEMQIAFKVRSHRTKLDVCAYEIRMVKFL